MSPVFLLCVVLAASRTVSSVNLNEACNKDPSNCADLNAECNTDAVCKCKVGFTEKESKCVANAAETTKPADSKPVETTPKSVSEGKSTEKEKQPDLSQPATKAPSKVPSTNSTMTPPKKGSAAAIVFNIACLLTSVFLSLVVQA